MASDGPDRLHRAFCPPERSRIPWRGTCRCPCPRSARPWSGVAFPGPCSPRRCSRRCGASSPEPMSCTGTATCTCRFWPGCALPACCARVDRSACSPSMSGRFRIPSRALEWLELAAEHSVGRLSVRAAEGLVAVNGRLARELEALGTGPRVRLIANGIDLRECSPAHLAERARLRAQLGWDSRPRVLFVGRPVARKGFEQACAAAEMAGGAFGAWWPWARDSEPQWRHAACPDARLGTRSRMPALYRAADAFLLPSCGEGFPVSAQEAAACGLPGGAGARPGVRPVCGRSGLRDPHGGPPPRLARPGRGRADPGSGGSRGGRRSRRGARSRALLGRHDGGRARAPLLRAGRGSCALAPCRTRGGPGPERYFSYVKGSSSCTSRRSGALRVAVRGDQLDVGATRCPRRGRRT